MKNVVVLFVLVLSFLAFETQAQKKSEKAEKAKKEMKSEKAKKEMKSENGKAIGNQEVSFSSSVQCEMCKDRIEKALSLVKGVKSSSVDVAANKINITYNSTQVSEEDLKKAVNEAGYDAEDMVADKEAHNKLPKCCQKGGH
jgi:copper chaperone CopZ